eukprot:3303533-Pyramimonas_sp.AAC.1
MSGSAAHCCDCVQVYLEQVSQEPLGVVLESDDDPLCVFEWPELRLRAQGIALAFARESPNRGWLHAGVG